MPIIFPILFFAVVIPVVVIAVWVANDRDHRRMPRIWRTNRPWG